MNSLEVVKSGLMTSIQDLGRKGLAYYAIPHSGAMDVNAAKIALLLLNLAEDNPLIECTSIAPHIRFHASTQIALTGADFLWTINEEKVPLNTVLHLQKGDFLKGKFAKEGLRGYIAIDGKLQVDKVYGSYSTYINAQIGGFQGRLLKKGDFLQWHPASSSALNKCIIPIHKGPEFDYLSPDSQQALTSNPYKIGVDSNRMGIRLRGTKLEAKTYQLKHSLPVLSGFVQLPPSGLPIVILQDGQTSGGYPRIAYVREQDLGRLNQVRLGGKIWFEWMQS